MSKAVLATQNSAYRYMEITNHLQILSRHLGGYNQPQLLPHLMYMPVTNTVRHINSAWRLTKLQMLSVRIQYTEIKQVTNITSTYTATNRLLSAKHKYRLYNCSTSISMSRNQEKSSTSVFSN